MQGIMYRDSYQLCELRLSLSQNFNVQFCKLNLKFPTQ